MTGEKQPLILYSDLDDNRGRDQTPKGFPFHRNVYVIKKRTLVERWPLKK